VLVREQGDYPLLTVNLLGCGGVIPNHMRLGRGGALVRSVWRRVAPGRVTHAYGWHARKPARRVWQGFRWS
jgi:hypothetical protein